MKKLLLVLAIGAFVACNDSGSTDNPAGGDTTPATNAAPESTPAPGADTTTQADTLSADTTMKK